MVLYLAQVDSDKGIVAPCKESEGLSKKEGALEGSNQRQDKEDPGRHGRCEGYLAGTIRANRLGDS